MSWAKLDDRFHENRKVRGLWRRNPAALGLHVMALTYCAGHETDGHVDVEFVEDKVPSGATRRKMTQALVDAGLWVEVDGGWEINDFLEFNPSKAEADAGRAVDRFRKELTRDHGLIEAIKNRDANACRYCGVPVNWRDRRGPSGGTYDHVVPVSAGGDNSFANVVVACRSCNCKKGPRTPEQAGMALRDLPGSGPDLPAGPDRGQKISSPVPTRPDPTPQENSTVAADATTVSSVAQIDEARTRLKNEAVDRVWQAYVDTRTAVLGPRSVPKFAPDRRALIGRRLKDWPEQDLVDAVKGWRHFPHNRGENDRGEPFCDIELLLRDTKHIEKFRDRERATAAPDAVLAKLTRGDTGPSEKLRAALEREGVQ